MGKALNDIDVGSHFGYWTVIGLDDGQHPYRVKCRCICGTIRWVLRSRLRTGKSKSCGCMAHPDAYQGLKPGDKVGYWTIIKREGPRFYCRCICGREKWVDSTSLLYGKSLSCGCRRMETRAEESAKAMRQGHELSNALQREKLQAKYSGFGRKRNKNSSTGVTGVCARHGRYRAYITVDRHQISLGYYDSIDDAIAARKAAEQRYFADRQEKADKIIKGYSKKTADK